MLTPVNSCFVRTCFSLTNIFFVGETARKDRSLLREYRFAFGTACDSFEALFDAATLPAAAMQVSGTVCGVRVEAVAHPLMRRIRILDKLVDELAKGRPLAIVLRDVRP